MKDMMSYRNYYGSVYFSEEENVFHGNLEFIKSDVS